MASGLAGNNRDVLNIRFWPSLAAAGIDERPQMALADSWYWSIDNLTTIPNAPELLIPPARHGRQAAEQGRQASASKATASAPP
jgi:hypothetical protein